MIIFVFFLFFFSILAVSMATAAILKKSTLKGTTFTWHMIFLQGFIKFDQGISEKCVGETFGRRKKERKKKNNNKKRSKHNSLGDIMTLISGSQYFICFFHPFPMNISLEQ
jgi:hypothetical protein